MFRASMHFQGFQVFFGSAVVTSKGSYPLELLRPDALTSRGSYIQRFLHSGLVRDTNYMKGFLQYLRANFTYRGLPSY